MRRAARRREGPRTYSKVQERGRATQRHYGTTALAAHADEPPSTTSKRQADSSKIVRNISRLGARHWFNIGARNADQQPAGSWATGARARAHRHKCSTPHKTVGEPKGDPRSPLHLDQAFKCPRGSTHRCGVRSHFVDNLAVLLARRATERNWCASRCRQVPLALRQRKVVARVPAAPPHGQTVFILIL